MPKLEEMIRTGKPGPVDRSTPESERKTLAAARIAVATLKPGDPIPRLIELLQDRTLKEYDRRTAVWRLGDRRDPRAIPALLQAIKTDPSGAVVNQAVTVLSVFKDKAAAEGLIGCFDAEFAGKEDWKRAYSPEMFRENIAESLRSITGKPFGPDKRQWTQWWEAEGRNDPGLK